MLEEEFSQKKVSLIVRQRRLRARKFFNFPMVLIASHFVQFQGISNPLFRQKKWKGNPELTIITPLGFSIVFREKK